MGNIKSFVLTRDIAETMTKHNLYFSQYGNADIEPRLNKKYFFDIETQVGDKCCLLVGNSFPKKIGSYSYSWSPLNNRFILGNYVSIAKGLTIMGEVHPYERFTTSPITYNKKFILSRLENTKINQISNPHIITNIIIEDDVWIARNVNIKSGVTIHTGAVVASNATVTKDVPPYAIVGGLPAKIIKYRFDEKIIEELLTSQWWKYDITSMDINSDLSIENFLHEFYAHKNTLSKLNSHLLIDLL